MLDSDNPPIPVPEEALKGSKGRCRTHSPNIEDIVKNASKRALRYESQMQRLSTKFTENLSNLRAMDSLVQESLEGLKRDTERANRALSEHIPRIHEELDSSIVSLENLSHTLTEIQSRVTDIRYMYDSGRKKAQTLETDLKWLNTEWHERWRVIIFTSRSPVSWQWAATMRLLFAITSITFAWIAWVAIAGVYRAHKQRLVWGERLIS